MAQSILPVEGVEYSANAFDDIFEALAVRGDAATQGVVRGKLNELAVSGTSSPLSVASGWAFVNGKLYKSTAAEEVAVPSPAAATRIDRIVLQLDYTAGPPMTCVLARVAGEEGGAAPALTQTDGTKWEISLAQASITTGGVITVTDERAYIGDGHVVTASIAADAVTGAKIADDQIDSEHYVDASIDTAHIANNQVTDAKLRDSAALSVIGRSSNSSGDPADIAAGSDGHVLRRSGTSIGFGTVAAAGLASDAVETAKIKDLNVTAAKLAANAVETAKIKDANVTAAKIAANAVETAKIKDANVTNAKLAASAKRIKGEIIMWSGSLGSGEDVVFPVDPDTAVVNRNWHICDGSTYNGVTTPNLRDRFVIAAGTSYQAGANGGSATKDLTHTHAKGTLGVNEHGAHRHETESTGITKGGVQEGSGKTVVYDVTSPAYTKYFAPMTHTVTGSTADGGSGTQDIMPPYYALTFLCYVGGN